MTNQTCPKLLAECIASGQVSAAQIEQHRVADYILPVSKPLFSFREVDFVPLGFVGEKPTDLCKWFQGPLPEIGDECFYVCTGRTPTSIQMSWVTRKHIETTRTSALDAAIAQPKDKP